jgi:hypothetical protein
MLTLKARDIFRHFSLEFICDARAVQQLRSSRVQRRFPHAFSHQEIRFPINSNLTRALFQRGCS